MRKLVIIVLILIAIAVVWYRWEFPTVSYRYRLSITVETDGQMHTGSSVIEVWYRFLPASHGRSQEHVRGQGVLVDLGTRGVLVAGLFRQPYDYTTHEADELAGRAFIPSPGDATGFPVTPENIRAISRMRELVTLAPNNLPPFIWFPNKADPATQRFVKPQDFASVIGDSARLVSAQLQITTDPIVINIDKELPLLGVRFIAPGSVP